MSDRASPTLWTEAVQAIRVNAVPGMVLWLVAASVVLSYYFWSDTQPLFAALSLWKSQGGFFASIVSTAFFAGVIPFVVLWVMPSTRSSATWGSFAFLTGFWAYRGFEIDLLYRFQGVMFGVEATVSTVAAKVAFDMLVYNVVWAASLQLLAYHWNNSGFRWDAFRAFPWRQYFTRSLPVALVSTWVVWIPVVSLTYSLPANLQIPLFNLAACFWSLVVATLTSSRR